MDEYSVHFKLNYKGETRRFVYTGVTLFPDGRTTGMDVRKRVMPLFSLTDKDRLMYRDCDSALQPLETSFDLAMAYTDAAHHQGKESWMPVCVHLAIVDEATAEEMKLKKEAAAAEVEMERQKYAAESAAKMELRKKAAAAAALLESHPSDYDNRCSRALEMNDEKKTEADAVSRCSTALSMRDEEKNRTFRTRTGQELAKYNATKKRIGDEFKINMKNLMNNLCPPPPVVEQKNNVRAMSAAVYDVVWKKITEAFTAVGAATVAAESGLQTNTAVAAALQGSSLPEDDDFRCSTALAMNDEERKEQHQPPQHPVDLAQNQKRMDMEEKNKNEEILKRLASVEQKQAMMDRYVFGPKPMGMTQLEEENGRLKKELEEKEMELQKLKNDGILKRIAEIEKNMEEMKERMDDEDDLDWDEDEDDERIVWTWENANRNDEDKSESEDDDEARPL